MEENLAEDEEKPPNNFDDPKVAPPNSASMSKVLLIKMSLERYSKGCSNYVTQADRGNIPFCNHKHIWLFIKFIFWHIIKV